MATAGGADKIAGEIATVFGLKVIPYPANWSAYGKAAGCVRNQLMLDREHPDEVWAFHEDLENSKGTKDMVERAEQAGIKVRKFSSSTSAIPLTS